MEGVEHFNGEVSQLLEALRRGNTEDLKHLEIVKEYGDFGQRSDGSRVAFFQWEAGNRKLVRYSRDGSLFLAQTSEVNENEEYHQDRDWFQVESEAHAEAINANLDGHQLSFRYRGPHIWTSDEKILFHDSKESPVVTLDGHYDCSCNCN